MTANDIQHGGSHYKGEYQHWDWAIDIELGYLESAATKYVARWEDKNGALDLYKAAHYMEKALEAHEEGRWDNCSFCNPIFHGVSDLHDAMAMTLRFCDSEQLSPLERDTIIACASWCDRDDARYAISLIYKMIRCVEAGQHPRDAQYWPGARRARLKPSTAQPAAHGNGQQGNGQQRAQPERSTTGMSAPFGYDGDG